MPPSEKPQASDRQKDSAASIRVFPPAVALANLWILLLTPLCAWVLQRFAILPEEAYLERRFGDACRAYRRRVRRWL